MLKYNLLIIFLIVSYNQSYAQKNDLKVLIGTTWQSASEEKGTLVFQSETQFSGYDGCNNFGATYLFSNSEGFQIEDMKITERFCADTKLFAYSFLYQAKSFAVKRKQAIFYDKDKKVLIKLKKQPKK